MAKASEHGRPGGFPHRRRDRRLLYHLCAVAGPRPAFQTTFAVEAPPPPDVVAQLPYLAGASIRNGIPSLHTTWALLVYWYSRRHGVGPRVFGAVWVVLTVLAMLGLGEHWLVDVAVSVPFAVAVRALLATRIPLSDRVRWLPLAAGALLYSAWLVVVRAPYALLDDALILRTLALLSTAMPLLLESRLHAREQSVDDDVPSVAAIEPRVGVKRLAFVLFGAGFATLVYAVALGKGLALAFGSGAIAHATVLVTFSVGTLSGALLAARRESPSPMRALGLCQVGVAVSACAAPFATTAVRDLYVSLASGGRPSFGSSLVVLQIALGVVVLFVPFLLIGTTLPSQLHAWSSPNTRLAARLPLFRRRERWAGLRGPSPPDTFSYPNWAFC